MLSVRADSPIELYLLVDDWMVPKSNEAAPADRSIITVGGRGVIKAICGMTRQKNGSLLESAQGLINACVQGGRCLGTGIGMALTR